MSHNITITSTDSMQRVQVVEGVITTLVQEKSPRESTLFIMDFNRPAHVGFSFHGRTVRWTNRKTGACVTQALLTKRSDLSWVVVLTPDKCHQWFWDSRERRFVNAA